MNTKLLLLGSAMALTIPMPALAQTAGSDTGPTERGPAVDSAHQREIVVTADYVRELDVLPGTSVIEGEALTRSLRGQIGDTLVNQPGVSATSFSPGASRPVLRGFQGERIRVLTDGLGSLDVSNTSADHAVTIDPLAAERIEILRGPAVLLFGSQAIGGAVNVLDRRIPREVPEGGMRLDAIGTLGSAANERSVGGSADIALGGGIVVHADGSFRETDNLDVGGFVLSRSLRADQLGIAAEEREEGHSDEADEAEALAAARGKLPNSGTRTWTAGGGVSLIRDGGSLGFSVAWYDSDYGVPERPGAGHAHGEEEGEDEGEGEGAAEPQAEEEGPVTIGLKQFRADMRGDVEVGGGFIDHIHVRGGFSDYTHTEFEGDEVGTVFNSEAFEGRIELVQADRNGWRGVIGAQGYLRDFEAIGAEAFVKFPARTTQFGLFTLQEFDLGRWGLEIGARYERTDVTSQVILTPDDDDGEVVPVDRSFDAFSGAVNLSYEMSPGIRIGVTGSRSERAPSAEELLSNGIHVATQSYEFGNPFFTTEKAWGAELYARGEAGGLHFHLSGYAQWFDDYIYEVETGEEAGGLPIYQFRQAGARYMGVEGEIEAPLVRTDRFTLTGNVVADYVDAELDAGGDLPRIPPLRILGGISAEAGPFGGRVEVEHSFAQKDVATFETSTDDFTLVNASVSWKPFGTDRSTIILSANNIFDVDARRHASFTKDFVPLSGRDVRLAVRFGF